MPKLKEHIEHSFHNITNVMERFNTKPKLFVIDGKLWSVLQTQINTANYCLSPEVEKDAIVQANKLLTGLHLSPFLKVKRDEAFPDDHRYKLFCISGYSYSNIEEIGIDQNHRSVVTKVKIQILHSSTTENHHLSV